MESDMARVLAALERRSRYPWKRWADGRPRAASHGTDFSCSAKSFCAAIYAHAKRHDLDVVVAAKGDRVEFQFAKKRSAKR